MSSPQMHRDVMIESKDGQSFLWRRFPGEIQCAIIAGAAAFFQALAYIVMGKDGRIFLKKRISACVVGMIMSIDNETNRFVCDPLESGTDFVGQRSELVVDHDNPIVANRDADVPSRAFKHVNVAGNLRDLQLYFAEVSVLGDSKTGKADQGGKKNGIAHVCPSAGIGCRL
jgi:hypothetical protein